MFFYAVYMASFVAVGSVDSGADKAVAYIVAGAQGGLCVGAVMRIYIYGKV